MSHDVRFYEHIFHFKTKISISHDTIFLAPMLHQISSLLLVLLTLLHLHLHLYQTLNLLIHLIHKHLHLANLLELKKLQIISITITIITSPVSLLHLNLYNIT